MPAYCGNLVTFMKRSLSKGFTLIEIMIIVGIIGILTLIAWPNFKTAREHTHRKICMTNMKRIEWAKSQFGMTVGSKTGEATWPELLDHLRFQPICPSGGTYEGLKLNEPVNCNIHNWQTDPEMDGFVP